MSWMKKKYYETQKGKVKSRRSCINISYYPSPEELYTEITRYESHNTLRDRALASLLYLLALRVSECLRLKASQFQKPIGKEYIKVVSIELSKRHKKAKPREHSFRVEARLPLIGPRKKFTDIVVEYLRSLEGEDRRLFPISTVRAWTIITNMLPCSVHALRAFGESYLYEEWDFDLLAVADYVEVDPTTLSNYIHSGWKKHKTT